MHDLFIGKEEWEHLCFSEVDVEIFSQLTGDVNPIHLEENYAQQTRFGSRIVHGVLVLGVFSKIIGTRMPGLGSIYLEQNVKFLKPIYINQEIYAVVRVSGILEEKSIVCLETDIMNIDKTEYIIRGTAKVLLESKLE